MPDLPESILVRVTPAPPEGLAVFLQFGMQRKNSFGFPVFVGPWGEARVSKAQLLDFFDHERRAFLMDYVDPRTNFTGAIEAHVWRPEDVRHAQRVFEMYRRHLEYPQDYAERLRRALEVATDTREYQAVVEA
jgi:hypothetical protein